MAQFQGIQVLSIKEAVLMQKKKIKRRDWSIFFHLFFFFLQWCKADPVELHQASVGSWRSMEILSTEFSPWNGGVQGPCIKPWCRRATDTTFSQQTPLCKVQTLSPVLQLKYNSFVTAYASSFMSWNGSVFPWVIGSELNFACANFFTFVWKKNWGD